MDSRTTFQFLTVATLLVVSTPNPSPQFYSTPFSGQQPPFRNPQESSFSSPQTWPQNLQNFSHPHSQGLPDFLDPLSSPSVDDILKNDVPRQVPQQQYGPPGGYPPSYQQPAAFPQIYKVDNLIIIANPQQGQGQPCIPQRSSTPQFPPLKIEGDSPLNRFGPQDQQEPSPCVWAIIACCSPGSNNVRYNCFEQLGCLGFFFDNSPCDAGTVKAAARAALEFYNSDNATSDGTNTNQLNK